MAKQKKAVIDQRIEKLKSLGYESVPNSQGNYHTGRELDRMTIQRKDIEYMPDEEWNVVMAKVEEDHSKHLPFSEAEVIEQPKELSVVDESMKKELKAFESNPLVVAIAEFKNKFAGLTFAGLEDKAAIEALKSAKKTVQKTRTFVTKHEETLKAPYLAHLNEIRAVSKKYCAMIEPIENPLDKELERLKALETAEEERIKAESEKEGNRRIEVLKEAGMKFGGAFYEIGDTISMDISTIKAMPIEDFDKFVIKVHNEKKRLDDMEEQRWADLKKERLTTRGNMLLTIGMVVDTDGAYATEHIEGVKITPACLIDEPDDRFMVLFSSLSGRIADAKQKAKDEADKKAKERTVSLRSKLILAIGMNKVDWIPGTTQTGFYFKNDFVECKLTLPEVEALTDDMFDATIEVNEKKIADAKAKAVKKEADDKAVEQVINDRSQQLIALGMTRAPKANRFIFNLPNVEEESSVDYSELANSAEMWEHIIREVTLGIKGIRDKQKAFEDKAAKDKEDKEKKDAKDAMTFQERQYQLVNLGMAIVTGSFLVKNEFNDSASITIEEVKALDEDVWPRRLMEVTQAVEDVKKKTETKRREIADKAEALKPEIQKCEEKINQVWDSIKETSSSNFTDEAVGNIYGGFYADVYKAVNNALAHLINMKK